MLPWAMMVRLLTVIALAVNAASEPGDDTAAWVQRNVDIRNAKSKATPGRIHKLESEGGKEKKAGKKSVSPFVERMLKSESNWRPKHEIDEQLRHLKEIAGVDHLEKAPKRRGTTSLLETVGSSPRSGAGMVLKALALAAKKQAAKEAERVPPARGSSANMARHAQPELDDLMDKFKGTVGNLGNPEAAMNSLKSLLPMLMDAKMIGKLIDNLIRFAIKKSPNYELHKAQNQALKATRANRTVVGLVKQTDQEKKQEPISRNLLRDNLMWFVRQIPGLGSQERGQIVGYWTSEAIAVRRTTNPQVRTLFDSVVSIPLQDLSVDSLYSKVLEFIKAWEKAGYHKVADSLTIYVTPFAKLLKYAGVDTWASMTLTSAAAFLRDLASVVPTRTDETTFAHYFIGDLADLLEGNAEKNLTALEVYEHIKDENSTTKAIPIAELVYTVRDFARSQSDINVVFPGLSRAILESGIRPEMARPIASMVSDIPVMWDNRTDLGFLLDRLFQTVNELDVVKSERVQAALDTIDTVDNETHKYLGMGRKYYEEYTGIGKGWVDDALQSANEFWADVTNRSTAFADKLSEVPGTYAKIMENGLDSNQKLSKELSEMLTVLVDNVKTGFGKVSNVVVRILKLGASAVKWGVCHLKDSREVYPQCEQILARGLPTVTDLRSVVDGDGWKSFNSDFGGRVKSEMDDVMQLFYPRKNIVKKAALFQTDAELEEQAGEEHAPLPYC